MFEAPSITRLLPVKAAPERPLYALTPPDIVRFVRVTPIPLMPSTGFVEELGACGLRPTDRLAMSRRSRRYRRIRRRSR